MTEPRPEDTTAIPSDEGVETKQEPIVEETDDDLNDEGDAQ